MSWIVNIAGKAEDFLNKIDQSTAVALQSGAETGISKSRSKKKGQVYSHSHGEYGAPTTTVLPTPSDTRVTLTNFTETLGLASSSKSFGQSVDIEPNNGMGMASGRTSSRPKPPRPSKLKNATKSASQDLGTNGINSVSSLNDQAFLAAAAKDIKTTGGDKTDEQLLDFLNSPSQNLDESSLLRSEIASQSREMNLLLRNYKKLQQEHDTLKKSCDFSNDTNHISIPNSVVVTNETEAMFPEYEGQIAMKDQEISQLREQLKAMLEKLETNEGIQSIKNRLAHLELENQRIISENEEMVTKLSVASTQLGNSETQLRGVKEKLVNVEKEYSSYKEKAKSILQTKDELITSMSSSPNRNQDGQNGNAEHMGSGSNQQPNEFQFLSEIGSLRSERELLQAEITQNRFYADSLREENNRLETELNVLRTSTTNLHSLLSKEKQVRHNHQEENLKLSQQISTLQLEFERERIEKMKLQERVEKYESGVGSGMRKIHSMNDFEQKYGPSNEFDETDTLRTRITALSQSLLEKQNYINALSADKQLLQLRIERLQAKVEEMNQEVEYHNAESFNLDTEGLSNHSVVSSQPLYLSESPWDSRIARRVKRAYAQVDTICCQIGLILRQRPNIRLGFCLYIIFLHLWVFFVLFSWSHNHTSADADGT